LKQSHTDRRNRLSYLRSNRPQTSDAKSTQSMGDLRLQKIVIYGEYL